MLASVLVGASSGMMWIPNGEQTLARGATSSWGKSTTMTPSTPTR